jgi:penicillin-binding protein 1B
MARRAGLNEDIRPTPAVALGSYDATPLEMAGAYTVFANQGVFVKPRLISTVRDRDGDVTYHPEPDIRKALDPRVAYLMVNLLGEVMRSGTAAGVRSRGFTAPAAGKTGTSHDGWFAGFTSNLLCVVWVGFDDNQELRLEGAKSALPVWTEFMKRALEYYPDAKPFARPDGITSADICPESGELASPLCPSKVAEVFIAGSEPQNSCAMHSGSINDPAQVAGGDGPATGVPIALPEN